ncbi:FtsK/SpoIIIE domain-containing protein [Dactylosporangium sp. NPDC051541]|uniref:FtsK/SpoIIIE domain-containing protein n=1 Tax=Dactylosporangium sp. NPDC051541 TaxID=3363977 RepID=UPI0037A0D7B6
MTQGTPTSTPVPALTAAAGRVARAGARTLGVLAAAEAATAAAVAAGQDAIEQQLRRYRQRSAKQGLAAAGQARAALTRAVGTLAPGAAADAWGRPPRPSADPFAVATHVRAGGLTVPGQAAVPLLVPLLDQAGLVLEGSGGDLGPLHAIALRALLGTGAGQLALHAFDPQLRGLFAPFAALRRAGGGLLGDIGTTPGDLDALLERLTAEVQRINELRQGRPVTLAGLRSAAGQPIEQFRLVAIADFPAGFTQQTAATLAALLRSGPGCGISFLIHHDPAVAPPAGVDAAAALHGVDVLATGGSPRWSRRPGVAVHLDPPIAPRLLAEAAEAVARAGEAAAAPELPLADLLDPPGTPPRSSADGISVPIGRSGAQAVELVLGDERTQRHNLLVTGAVGQGKSNFLKVVVHALAARYSPQEVRLYLLDLKEGVTFHALASTPASRDWLPQAAVIGFETDREFAVAVLESLVGEFRRRAAIIKPYGDKLSTYRARVPDAVMPRIVVVIDEFQILFAEDDETTTRAAGLLERLAKQGRAYGIHLLLASQTISGIAALLAKQDGIYAQFPIRVAFKNSAGESRAVLDQHNPDAAELRYRGEAIVNLEFGRRDANQRVTVAAADDATLDAVRRRCWLARPAGAAPPEVFEGGRPVTLVDAVERLRDLRAVARADPAAGRIGLLGLAVAHPLRAEGVVFAAEPGRHLAILGAGGRRSAGDGAEHLALGAMQAAAVSLALQHPAGDARFTLLDPGRPGAAAEPGLDALGWLLERLGLPLRVVPHTELGAELRRIAAGLAEPAGAGDAHYVLAPALDRAGALATLDENMVSDVEVLRAVLRDGPARRTHLIAWWTSVGMYRTHLGFDASVETDAVLALRVSPRDVVDLMGHTVTWQPTDNRGLLYDRQEFPAPVTIVPTAPLTRADANTLLRVDWEQR